MNDILVYCPTMLIYMIIWGNMLIKMMAKNLGIKTDFPIIDSESWAKKQFGKKGIVN